jgi:hypothetical protein
VRYRTAGILSLVLVAGMFVLPATVKAVFLPSLRQGLPNPVPGWEQILLSMAVFCLEWQWLIAIPIVVVLFTVAGFTGASESTTRT